MRATDYRVINPPATQINRQRAGIVEFDPLGASLWIRHHFIDQHHQRLSLGWLPTGTDDRHDYDCCH